MYKLKSFEKVKRLLTGDPKPVVAILSNKSLPEQRSSSDKGIFSLVDRITKPKVSNSPNVFKIGLFR